MLLLVHVEAGLYMLDQLHLIHLEFGTICERVHLEFGTLCEKELVLRGEGQLDNLMRVQPKQGCRSKRSYESPIRRAARRSKYISIELDNIFACIQEERLSEKRQKMLWLVRFPNSLAFGSVGWGT